MIHQSMYNSFTKANNGSQARTSVVLGSAKTAANGMAVDPGRNNFPWYAEQRFLRKMLTFHCDKTRPSPTTQSWALVHNDTSDCSASVTIVFSDKRI
jgi:hypothetical protein